MSESSSLHIHTRAVPNGAQTALDGAGGPSAEEGACAAVPGRVRSVLRRHSRRISRGDALLRNGAIACALLLGILALGRLEAPWAKVASERIEQALTLRIDLDESIGALQFVRDLMPESALVFMNIGSEDKAVAPVDGALSHRWTNLQPWLIYQCGQDDEVRAVKAGTVTAVSSLSEGKVGILIDHGSGLESLYAGLDSADVRMGDAVERGRTLGRAKEDLYFEYRSGGESIDPSPLLGL